MTRVLPEKRQLIENSLIEEMKMSESLTINSLIYLDMKIKITSMAEPEDSNRIMEDILVKRTLNSKLHLLLWNPMLSHHKSKQNEWHLRILILMLIVNV